jgi:hypothetical protein
MNLITFPARPMTGGRLGLLPKPRLHLWSNKLNGWRAPVHTPTGTMWNRHGKELSIAEEFSEALESLSCFRLPWLDCEAMERRHAIGRGSLIVLDLITPDMPAHLPSLMVINSTEYAATGSGPVLAALICASWTTIMPPGMSAA